MKIATRTLGTIEIDDDRVMQFVGPMLGLEEAVRYALLDVNPESPVKLLQVTDDPDTCFMVADPQALFPDYTVELRGSDVADLELTDPSKAVVLVVLNLHKDPQPRLTANLLGPIVVNTERLLAKQVVLRGGAYRADEPVPLAV